MDISWTYAGVSTNESSGVHPTQCGVELRLWGGKTPHTKTGGVEFSTPKLHPTVGWSLVQIWGRWGGVGWSAFFRFSVNSTPQWGGVWGGVEGYDWREAPENFQVCVLLKVHH